MYGTIFTMNVKAGHEQALRDFLNSAEEDVPSGMIGWFLMKPDEGNNELIGVAVFESKEAHLANANRPEQHDMFTGIMAHLTSEPTWRDGEYIAGQIA